MSATMATLPLMLELTQPLKVSPLVGDMVEGFDVFNTKYNSETQVRENSEGIPQFFNYESGTWDWDYGAYYDGWDAE